MGAAAATWFDERIAQLEAVCQEEGGEPLDAGCIERAREVARVWEKVTGERPFVTVIYDGEIQIEGDHHEVEIRKDGRTRWLLFESWAAEGSEP